MTPSVLKKLTKKYLARQVRKNYEKLNILPVNTVEYRWVGNDIP